MPTRRPAVASRWAISRVTVVVLPLVPVTATTGMRPSSPGANRWPMMASPTGAALAVGRRQVHAQAGRGIDLDDAAALLLQRAQHALADHVDAADVAGRPSAPRPPRARPRRGARRRSRRWRCRRCSGWRCCAAARARPLAGTESGVEALRLRAAPRAMSSKRILVSEVAWPSPRRGSALTWSTSSRTVCTPSPITCGGSRRAAATSLLPTTSRRKSLPGRNFSTITVADLARPP